MSQVRIVLCEWSKLFVRCQILRKILCSRFFVFWFDLVLSIWCVRASIIGEYIVYSFDNAMLLLSVIVWMSSTFFLVVFICKL